MNDALLTTKLLARRWRISPRTLERWRADSVGPCFLRIGRHIRYRDADVQAFERDHAGLVPGQLRGGA